MAVRHVYASLAQFNDFLRDNGASTFSTEVAAIIDRKLAILESVSRDIDEFCDRSRFGSGFGPRTGTNRYNGDGSDLQELWDDLLSITSVSVLDGTAGAATTYTDETDFYKEPYDLSPYRRLRCHGETSNNVFKAGRRTVSVVGSWGYSDERVTASATLNEALDATETGVDVSVATEFSAGNTILIGSEQMLVTSKATNTLTVVRGVNGTTAATHTTGASIDYYRYPRQVTDACLRVALRRWRARDAGTDGTEGGGEMPGVLPVQSERSILWMTVGSLKKYDN